MKKFQVLILGIETKIGQEVYYKLKNSLPHVKICVPSIIYSENTDIPSNMIPLSTKNKSQLVSTFSKFVQIIVLCSNKYYTQEIIEAAKETNTCFINAIDNYSQTVIESVERKMVFNPSQMQAYQYANETSILCLLRIALQQAYNLPIKTDDHEWIFKQDDCYINGKTINRNLVFKNCIFAYFFYFCSIILRLIFPLNKNILKGNSKWKFIGETIENKKRYKFVIETGNVNADYLRADLVTVKINEKLDVINGIGDIQYFSRLNIALKSYEYIKKQNN